MNTSFGLTEYILKCGSYKPFCKFLDKIEEHIKIVSPCAYPCHHIQNEVTIPRITTTANPGTSKCGDTILPCRGYSMYATNDVNKHTFVIKFNVIS
jgi:hypothetical protein